MNDEDDVPEPFEDATWADMVNDAQDYDWQAWTVSFGIISPAEEISRSVDALLGDMGIAQEGE